MIHQNVIASPILLEGYKVFIASPGGLQDERLEFRRILESYNRSEAIHHNIQFIPTAWEETITGVGRPQELINQDLEQCHFFVLVLHDRWGRPTHRNDGVTTGYSSGVEEEFAIAKRMVKEKKLINLLVLFKTIPPERMQDKGPQLTKVMLFREQMEEEQEFFYRQYDSKESFSETLRDHIGAWMRSLRAKGSYAELPNREQVGVANTSLSGHPINQQLPSDGHRSAQIVEIWNLFDQGLITAAEKIFSDMLLDTSVEPIVYVEYARLLFATNRADKALEASVRGIAMAEAINDVKALPQGFLVRGEILEAKKDFHSAEASYKDAYSAYSKDDSLEGLSLCLSKIGRIHRKTQNYSEAMKTYQSGIGIAATLKSNADTAMHRYGLGHTFYDQKQYARAVKEFEVVLDLDRVSGGALRLTKALRSLAWALTMADGMDSKVSARITDLLAESGRLAMSNNFQYERVLILQCLGLMRRIWRNEVNDAITEYQKALQICEVAGYYEKAVELKTAIDNLWPYREADQD